MNEEIEKERLTVQLNKIVVDVLGDIAIAGDFEKGTKSFVVRKFIEMQLDCYIRKELKGLYVDATLNQNTPFDKLCKMFLLHRRAMREPDKYKMIKGQNNPVTIVVGSRETWESETIKIKAAEKKLKKQPYLIQRIVDNDSK